MNNVSAITNKDRISQSQYYTFTGEVHKNGASLSEVCIISAQDIPSYYNSQVSPDGSRF